MKWLFGVGLGLATLGVGNSIGDLRPQVNPVIAPSGLDAQDTHAAVSLLGQFRTSLSSWLYLHADLYLHNGVEMRPLTEGERAVGRRGVGSADKKEDQLHSDDWVVTVIPTEERDFRGIFGTMERKTSAFRDMQNHHHNDPRLALPLFRLMTLLDPQFIAGWSTGAMVIARERGEEGAKKALVFLQEGREHNPQSVEIIGAMGKLYLTRFIKVSEKGRIQRSLHKAKPLYEEACRIAWENRRTLSEAERDATLENFRFLCLLYRDLGDRAKQAEAVQQGLSLFPDDPILLRLAG